MKKTKKVIDKGETIGTDTPALDFVNKIISGAPEHVTREDFDSFLRDSYAMHTFDTRAKFDKASDKINEVEEVMDLRHSDLHRRNRLLEKRVRDLEELVPSFWEQVVTIAVGLIFIVSTSYSLYIIGGQLNRIRAVVSGNCLMTDAECTYFTN